jgi:hypothetical protein
MPDRFLLERIYRRSEFSPAGDDRLRVAGTLLGAAMDGAYRPDPIHERLVGELDDVEARSRQ